jgi:hypothetical protein
MLARAGQQEQQEQQQRPLVDVWWMLLRWQLGRMHSGKVRHFIGIACVLA